MRNVRRRLEKLERLPQPRPAPSPLERIRMLALESLSQQDFELVAALVRKKAAEKQTSELSECEAAVCAAWTDSLEREAQRMGFKSLAAAQRATGQRR